MNWKSLKEETPAVYDWMAREEVDEHSIVRFFDTHQVVVLTTYHRDAEQPWGYEVVTSTRFVREEANYPNRDAAQSAGLRQAAHELNRHLAQAT